MWETPQKVIGGAPFFCSKIPNGSERGFMVVKGGALHSHGGTPSSHPFMNFRMIYIYIYDFPSYVNQKKYGTWWFPEMGVPQEWKIYEHPTKTNDFFLWYLHFRKPKTIEFLNWWVTSLSSPQFFNTKTALPLSSRFHYSPSRQKTLWMKARPWVLRGMVLFLVS